MLVTFAITRHPFRRLADSYYVKLKHEHIEERHAELKENFKMIWGYVQDLNERIRNVTPNEFATYLLDLNEKRGPLSFNEHWRPQYTMCPFCRLNFDYIGDIEDMDNHVEYLSDLLGFKVSFQTNKFVK